MIRDVHYLLLARGALPILPRFGQTKVMAKCAESLIRESSPIETERVKSRIQVGLARLALSLFVLAGAAFPAPFVVFPKAGQLASPNGRWVVRNVDPAAALTDFSGTFHSLWLTELPTGRSRKLCDYLGVAAVAWSGNDVLVVTQYFGRKSSRVIVFSANDTDASVLLDLPTLIRLVPPEQRAPLRENDHIFIEGSLAEAQTLYLRVWGYGKQPSSGFPWRCQYSLPDGQISCDEEKTAK